MIKILVSTKNTQGWRKNDFCFVPEEQPVWLGFVCDRDKNNPDGSCGCSRSMVGVENLKGTTTFVVAPFNGSIMAFDRIIGAAIEKSLERPLKESDDDMVSQESSLVIHIASKHDIGTVLERRGDRVFRPRIDSVWRKIFSIF